MERRMTVDEIAAETGLAPESVAAKLEAIDAKIPKPLDPAKLRPVARTTLEALEVLGAGEHSVDAIAGAMRTALVARGLTELEQAARGDVPKT